jgi:Fe-S cluster assembly protein SufD
MSALGKTPHAAEEALAGAFAAAPRKDVQRRAFARFEEMGLPHRRLESWRYTDLRTRWRATAPFATERDAQARAAFVSALGASDDILVVFLDGTYVSEATRAPPHGVTIHVGRELIWPETARSDAMVALNEAFAETVEIDVAAGVALERPIHIVSTVTGAYSSAQRVLVRVGSRAEVSVIETHRGAGAHQKNCALVFEAGDGAKVEHVARHVEDHDGANIVSSFGATLGAHAQLDSFALIASGEMTRRQLFVRFAGDHSRIALRGASLVAGKQHADTTLVVDHAGLHCESRERFKTIVDDEAAGVYQGKVIVREGAQKTDGAMKSDAILLSEEARMFNRPELEIFADDVVCGHGATVGQLNDDQLFYLRARGLPKAEAEKLLLEAFAGQVIDEVSSEAMRDALHEAVQAWLRRRG